jgi:acyl-CoA thioesterase YciA
VAVDKIIFHSPVYIGDEVSLYAQVVKVGRTSLTIEVEAWRRSQDGDDQLKVTQASFVFVAVDRGRRPRPLPRDSEDS